MYKISVITAAYNVLKNVGEKRFRRSIQSIHEQKGVEVEHIVIDGGSHDGTVGILEEYNRLGWLTYLSESDNGVFDAMNKGIAIASGDYVSIINTDDILIYDEVFVDDISKIEEENGDFCYAKAKCIDWWGEEKKCDFSDPKIENILLYMPVCTQTLLLKRDMFEQQMYDTSYTLLSDYQWLLNMVVSGKKGVYLEKQVVEYNLCGLSGKISSRKRVDKEYCRALCSVIDKRLKGIRYDSVFNMRERQVLEPDVWNALRKDAKMRLAIENTEAVNFKADEIRLRRLLLRHFAAFDIMNIYFSFISKGFSVADELRRMGYGNCAIYGAGYEGRCLLDDLTRKGFNVDYLIDKNAKKIQQLSGLRVVDLEEQLKPVDVIIVSPVYYWDEIYDDLSQVYDGSIICLEDLLMIK